MPHVRVRVVRLADDSFPGSAECLLRDARGREWRFAEKLPVLGIDDGDALPETASIPCTIVGRAGATVTIDVDHPQGPAAVPDDPIFTVKAGDVVE